MSVGVIDGPETFAYGAGRPGRKATHHYPSAIKDPSATSLGKSEPADKEVAEMNIQNEPT